MLTRNQIASTVPIINVISPTQEPATATSLQNNEGTPAVKRTFTERHSTSSDNSDTGDGGHEPKRGKLFSISDTFLELSTQNAVFEMDNSLTEDTVVIKTTILQSILTKLDELQQQVKKIENSQEKLKIDHLSQDIKTDKILNTIITLKEDFRADKILSKVVEVHNKSTTPSITPHSPHTRENIPSHQTNTITRQQTTSDHTNQVPIWKSKFHKRRMAYKQMYYNTKKAEILKGHVEAKNIYIQRKHRPKYCYSQEDYQDRLAVSKALQIQESKSLINSAKQHQTTIRSIDREIEDSISRTILNPTQRDELRKRWKDEVAASQIISEKMAEDNISYMKELPTRVPFTGFREMIKRTNGTYQLPSKNSDSRSGSVDNSENNYQQHSHNYYKGNYRGYRGKKTFPNLVNGDTNRNWREPSYRVFNNSAAQPANSNPFRKGTK